MSSVLLSFVDSCFIILRVQVIANDIDVQRCNLLIHQTKRMCSANLIVTNHEAQHFPSCRLNTEVDNGRLASSSLSCHIEEAVMNQLLFDRVLCDVPCSGDGTLRKAPDIWRKWLYYRPLFGETSSYPKIMNHPMRDTIVLQEFRDG